MRLADNADFVVSIKNRKFDMNASAAFIKTTYDG